MADIEQQVFVRSPEKIPMSAIGEGENVDDQQQNGMNSSVQSNRVTWWTFIFLVLGIVFHVFDVGSDIFLAIDYIRHDKILYSSCTIAFIILPTIVNTFMGFRMFKQQISHHRTTTLVTWKRRDWSRALVHLLHLGPVFYNCNSLRYAWKSWKYENAGNQSEQLRYYEKVQTENQEFAILKIFDTFLEAVPQQILLLTILLSNKDVLPSWIQIFSLCTSFISMSITLVSYNRTIRLAQPDKNEINILGTVLQFPWHLCIIVSRIIAISILASNWPLYTILYCLAHWTGMWIWLIIRPYGIRIFCTDNHNRKLTPKERCRCVLFAAVLGIVYIFTYLNPSEKSTFRRQLIFYTICGVENLAAAVLWAVASDKSVKSSWYFELLPILCTVLFLLGIVFLILYYKYSHPTLQRPTPSSEQGLLQCDNEVNLLGCLVIFLLCKFT